MERRLAAILATDVVGYSRLIREDEASTLAALKAHREDLIETYCLIMICRVATAYGPASRTITSIVFSFTSRARYTVSSS
jgi:class 3 adenylate cyclase